MVKSNGEYEYTLKTCKERHKCKEILFFMLPYPGESTLLLGLCNSETFTFNSSVNFSSNTFQAQCLSPQTARIQQKQKRLRRGGKSTQKNYTKSFK